MSSINPAGDLEGEINRVIDYAVRMESLNDDMDIVDCMSLASKSRVVMNLSGFIDGRTSVSELISSFVIGHAVDSVVKDNGDIIRLLENRLRVERRFRESMEMV